MLQGNGCDPFGVGFVFVAMGSSGTGGIAALNHRLIAVNPSGSSLCAGKGNSRGAERLVLTRRSWERGNVALANEERPHQPRGRLFSPRTRAVPIMTRTDMRHEWSS